MVAKQKGEKEIQDQIWMARKLIEGEKNAKLQEAYAHGVKGALRRKEIQGRTVVGVKEQLPGSEHVLQKRERPREFAEVVERGG